MFQKARMIVIMTVMSVLALWSSQASAVLYQEVGGQVVGEAEVFTRRTFHAQGDGWFVVPNEDAGAGTINGAREGVYVQSLPDDFVGGGPLNAPSIEYDIKIVTTGTYQLFVRNGNNQNVNGGGNSDSFFADIVQIKDGVGGTLPDWYEFSRNDNDFQWDAGAGFEQNVGGPANNAALFAFDTAGIYTLRFSQREDGQAIDAFALQLQGAGLTAPTGSQFGPAASALIIPEPSTALLALFGMGAMARRRRLA